MHALVWVERTLGTNERSVPVRVTLGVCRVVLIGDRVEIELTRQRLAPLPGIDLLNEADVGARGFSRLVSEAERAARKARLVVVRRVRRVSSWLKPRWHRRP